MFVVDKQLSAESVVVVVDMYWICKNLPLGDISSLYMYVIVIIVSLCLKHFIGSLVRAHTCFEYLMCLCSGHINWKFNASNLAM